MIQKKICLLGAFAVGKTSLINRFVNGIFSEKYLTTIGVKIDKKIVDINDTEVKMIIWDLTGEDDIDKIKLSYLKGMAGYFLVADLTRLHTLETALSINKRIEKKMKNLPFVLLLNKEDLVETEGINNAYLEQLKGEGIKTIFTSAKTGKNVEKAFLNIAGKVV